MTCYALYECRGQVALYEFDIHNCVIKSKSYINLCFSNIHISNRQLLFSNGSVVNFLKFAKQKSGMINKKNSFAKNDNFETQPFEKYKYTNFLLIFKVIKHQIANPVKIPDFHRKCKMTFRDIFG